MPIAAIENIFPFLIPMIVFMIPIVAILTHHQRKMAELMHGTGGDGVGRAEVESLRQEIRELKQLVHQQTIALDGIQRSQLPPLPPSQVHSEVS